MDRPALPALTSIRFFAALSVVFFHYAPALPRLLQNVVANGYLAVNFFFVLSGFVLAYNYCGRPIRSRTFWGARFARVYPCYLLGLILISPAVIARLGVHKSWQDAVAGGLAAVLLQAWFPKFALRWNGPGWSLSNEAFFYLLFPIILPRLARLSSTKIWAVATGCGLAALAPAFVHSVFYDNQDAAALMYMPIFRLPEFVVGAAAGVARVRQAFEWRFGTAPVVAALGAFLLFSPFWIPPLFRTALAVPLFAALIGSLAMGGRSAELLSCRPLQTLGHASYAVYILQSPMMAWFLFATRGWRARSGRAPLGWPEFAIFTAILVGVALACHIWLETPARRWIQSWRIFQASAAEPRCKIRNGSYDASDSVVGAGRILHRLRTKIRGPASAQTGFALFEARQQPDRYRGIAGGRTEAEEG
jgi:peptidoglycan/LPS O-acetylase OafA/YrhL